MQSGLEILQIFVHLLSYIKAFTTPTYTFDVRIMKDKFTWEFVFNKVHLSTKKS